MGFESIFAWKSLPEAGFGKNVGIDGHRCDGSWLHAGYSSAARLVVQDGSSDACVDTREASAARAASF
jgi:hypothetical protein